MFTSSPSPAIKIGLLLTSAELTLDFVKNHSDIPIVLDPFLYVRGLADVEVSQLRDELVKIFPLYHGYHSNLPEVELLIDRRSDS